MYGVIIYTDDEYDDDDDDDDEWCVDDYELILMYGVFK